MPVAASALVPFANCPTCLSTGGGGGTVTTLGALTDVTLTGPFTAGQTLRYNGFQWVNAPLDLNDLGDVDAAVPTDGQTIVWDSTANAGAGGYVLGNAGTAANPSIHLTNTTVAPATAGTPTLAEIAVAAGANRDVFLTYTGTDNPADPVTYTYYIDPAGAVVLVEAPPVASCALRELGGVGGVLAVGDGLGIPNPVTAGFTLQSDELAGIATTAPIGGSDVFEVRLMPGPTVISTGTIAAGTNTATFTPFADVAFAAGQWVETVVTAVAPTPGAELTVAGEVCGPGVSASGAGFSDRDEVFKTSVLPADDTDHDLVDLEGHAVLPNGLYRFDNQSGTWVQV